MIRSLLPLLLLACDPVQATCDALAEGPATLELGQGQDAWAPVAEGDTLPVDFGPQGGWHTYGTLRTTGLHVGDANADPPFVTMAVTADDGSFTGGYTDIQRFLLDGGDGVGLLVGDRLILDVADGSEADGAEVTIDARIEDVCGRSATDARGVVLSLRE